MPISYWKLIQLYPIARTSDFFGQSKGGFATRSLGHLIFQIMIARICNPCPQREWFSEKLC
jgi:hypothetical protein